MAAVAAGGLVGKGRDISLAALQRHDPYINRIVDVASQVALYTFGHRANEWVRVDAGRAGRAGVGTRSSDPGSSPRRGGDARPGAGWWWVAGPGRTCGDCAPGPRGWEQGGRSVKPPAPGEVAHVGTPERPGQDPENGRRGRA